ncbi:MAG: poly-gamma-glutamate biosynthesis protein PgsC [Calditrichaeota bacterium]|nr:poly-gamma-glutamate biosynthesis protein PgsC [Calditrichota bacterium]MCB9368277.1 poly-gamma-glutamate biosynthesis protein PgsC [Calditrichota bacterium]
MIELTIGLGVLVSLLFHEIVGAAAGGIVVPGYIAMHLSDPAKMLGTFLVAFVAFLCIRLVSKFMFVYGRRRMVLAIMFGFIFGYISRNLISQDLMVADLRLEAIGFIIPGLIANWFERQGVVKTLATMLIAAPLVKLLVMVLTGGEIYHGI